MPSPSAKDADADEYDVICATIMASARGRQFLQEFARRNRHADTMQMLAAITRTEDVIRERSGEPYQSFRGELLEMAKVIEALAGTVLPASALHDPADGRAQTLAGVLGFLERRIQAMLAGTAAAPMQTDSSVS